MNIGRLPSANIFQQAAAATTARVQTKETSIEVVAESSRTTNSQSRIRSSDSTPVQGEFLARERSLFQSTRSFVVERSFDNSALMNPLAGQARASRNPLSQYQNNIYPEPVSERIQGRSIDTFV